MSRDSATGQTRAIDYGRDVILEAVNEIIGRFEKALLVIGIGSSSVVVGQFSRCWQLLRMLTSNQF